MIHSFGAIMIAGIVGFLLGLMYFASLWRSVSSLVNAKRATPGFALAAVLRVAALAVMVGVLLWIGIAPVLILGGGLGFFAARLVMTSRFVSQAREH